MPPLDAATDPFGAAGLVQAPDGSWSLPTAAPPIVAQPNPAGGPPIDPTTGLPAPASMPDTQGRVGVTPVIDVGTPMPGAQPGQMGSQLRPIQVGPQTTAGAALPAAAVPAQPPSTGAGAPQAAAAIPTDPFAAAGLVQGPGGLWMTPDQAQIEAQTAAPAAAVPAAPAAPSAIPASVRSQTVRQQPWYQPLSNAIDTMAATAGEAGHAFTFGLDEIVAPIPAAAYRSLSQGIPFSQAYDEVLASQRAPRHQLEELQPTAATAASLVGGVASPINKAVAPLFATAPAGASAATRAVTAARNVGASSLVGAGTAATMAEGGLQERAEAARQGALLGGTLGVAVPATIATGRLIGSPVRAVAPLLNPVAAGQREAGRVLRQAAGGPLPPMAEAPTPNVQLNVAQASGDPRLAQLVRTVNATDQAGMEAEQSAQNQAALAAVRRIAPAAGPGAEAGEASAAAARAVQKANEILRVQRQYVWNKPSLLKPTISSSTTKDAVDAKLADIRRQEPALGVAYAQSDALKAVVQGMHMLPDKLSANQLNSVRSQFLTIGRNQDESGMVRRVAFDLAAAAHDGLFNAPEVAGRAPATQAELDAAAARQAAAPPVRPTWAGGAPEIGAGRAPRRPQTFLDAVVRAGGVKPDADLKAMNADLYHHRQGGRLLNPSGMSANQLREFAMQEGFARQGETDEHAAKEMIRDSLNGIDHYRPEDMADADYWRQIDEHQARETYQRDANMTQVRDVADAAGVKLTPAMQEHAAELMLRDPNLTAEDAARQASYAGEEAALQANAQRLAFGAPGVEPSARTTLLPDLQTLREGVEPDPELVRDLNAARAFTKREAETLGHASFDNILRRNSRGNETALPGTAMGQFFDFATGQEKPGTIDNVVKFLNDIKSEWTKLNDRTGGMDPAAVAQVQRELVSRTRDYFMSKFLGQVSGSARDISQDRLVGAAQASKWLDRERDMLRRSGVFTSAQMDDLDALNQTFKMIQRGEELGRARGSPTMPLIMSNARFMDVFMTPFTSRALGVGIGGMLGALTGQGALGTLFGAESGFLGAEMLRRLYEMPREEALHWLNRAVRDPMMAADFAKRATPANAAKFSNTTKAMLRTLLATQPAAQGARITTAPQQPGTAQ